MRDGILAQMPAEINNPAVTHVREVAQALVDIFDVDAHLLDLLKQIEQMSGRLNVGNSLWGESVERNFVPHLLNLRIQSTHFREVLTGFNQNRSELWDQLLCFR